MSIGLFPFLFFLVALPGVIFRRFYYQGEFSNQFQAKQIVISLFYSFIIGAFIIYSSIILYNYYVISWLEWPPLSKEKLKVVILKCANDKFSAVDLLDYIYDSKVIVKAMILCLIISSFSAVLAVIAYRLIRSLRLDKSIKSLTFDNHWYYYFRGEFLRFSDFNIKYKKIHWVSADILVNIDSNNTKLYSGIVKQYYIDHNTNRLSTIHLSDVFRYKSDGTTTKIPSHCFIIPYDRVVNINLQVVFSSVKNNNIFILLTKIQPVLILVFLIFPYFILGDYFNNNYKFPLIATIFFSIYSMTLPVVVINVFDQSKKVKEKLNTILGYIILGILSILNYWVLYILLNFFNI